MLFSLLGLVCPLTPILILPLSVDDYSDKICGYQFGVKITRLSTSVNTFCSELSQLHVEYPFHCCYYDREFFEFSGDLVIQI